MAPDDTRELRDLDAARRRIETLTAQRDSTLEELDVVRGQLAEARASIAILDERVVTPPDPGAMCPTCSQRKAEEGVVPFHLVLPLSEALDRTLTDDDRKLMTQLVAGAVMTAMGEALERITHAPRRGIYVPGVPGSPPRRT